MSNKPFHYQHPFPLKKDDTEYYLLTSDHVSVAEFEGQEIVKVAPQALTLLARQAFHDASFMLRPAHQQQVALFSVIIDHIALGDIQYPSNANRLVAGQRHKPILDLLLGVRVFPGIDWVHRKVTCHAIGTQVLDAN